MWHEEKNICACGIAYDEDPYWVSILAKAGIRDAEAFSQPSIAHSRVPDLRLVLFGGEGPAQFSAAGLSAPEGVVFAGRVSDAELSGLMDQALCYAMPSITEGFGLPPDLPPEKSLNLL